MKTWNVFLTKPGLALFVAGSVALPGLLSGFQDDAPPAPQPDNGGAAVVGNGAAVAAVRGDLRPLLARDYGVLIEIQGTITDPESPASKIGGVKLIRITEVGGEALSEPVAMELSGFPYHPVPVGATGQQIRLRGYESGSFTGIPADAFRDLPQASSTAFSFTHVFMVTKRLDERGGLK